MHACISKGLRMDIHVWVQANRVFVWFLIGLLALLTLFFAFGGMQQYGAEGWGLILVAVFLGVMTERVARYYLLPQMSLTKTHLVIRPFWLRTVKWPIKGTAIWETEHQRIEKDWRGRRLLRPLTVERLFRTDTQGLTMSVVLPSFAGHNERILKAISERSDVSVTVR